jgi:hypothetical protein
MASQVEKVIECVRKGIAYQVDTEVGAFVCVEAHKVILETNPVHDPILNAYKAHPLDFPIWVPFIDGVSSPFGKGLPTANLSLIL